MDQCGLLGTSLVISFNSTGILSHYVQKKSLF